MKRIAFCLIAVLLLPALSTAGRPVVGALDTDVNPDECEVWLDGRAIGRADDFDGWPGYLYLSPGSHTLEFRLEGYETFRAEVKVAPWSVTRLEHRLVRLPPSVASEPPPEVEENEAEISPPPPPADEGTARLELTVIPENSVIYLDGAFWMTGDDLARIHSPLQIQAGRHTLLCYAPGFEEVEQDLDAGPGELITIEIVLTEK